MFFLEAGGVESLTELLPAEGCIGGETGLLRRRERSDRGHERADGLLHAFIGWSQLELGVEGFQVKTELVFEGLDFIGRRGRGIWHGNQVDDTV